MCNESGTNRIDPFNGGTFCLECGYSLFDSRRHLTPDLWVGLRWDADGVWVGWDVGGVGCGWGVGGMCQQLSQLPL